MFGLLAGLAVRAVSSRLGGGGSGGGILGGLLNRSNNNSGGQSPAGGGQSAASPKDAPMAPAPQDQPGQTKPETQVAQPQQQPFQPAPVQQAAKEIEQPVAQEKAEKANPLKGLLDEAPAAPNPVKKPDAPVAPPQDVTNKTETLTPVARPTDEVVGQTPVLEPADGLPNRLMDAASNRQPFDYQDANPSRTPDLPNQSYTADQGYRYVGQTVVGGAMPARRYRTGV